MAGKKTTAVAKQGPRELVQADFGEHAGFGFEDVRQEELQLPFLALLQDLSPQVKGTTKIDGAEVGMFYDTVTQELYGANDELIFVPCMRDHCYMEWVPRKKGGGLVGRHELDDPIVAKAKEESEEFGKYKTAKGNDLVETYYVFGVLIANGEPQPVCIPFTSSKIAAWKKYFTRLTYVLVQGPDGKRQTPPLFAHRIRIGSKDDRNKNGDEFKNITLTPAEGSVKDSMVLDTEDEIFQSALGLAQMVRAGTAKVDYEQQAATGDGAQVEDDDRDPEGVFDDDVM